MVRVFIRHNVRDYAAWREAYDGFGETQREHGVRAEAVYRGVDDSNDVTVTHDFDDAATAKTFMGLSELKDAMSRAGVEGQPEIWLTEEV